MQDKQDNHLEGAAFVVGVFLAAGLIVSAWMLGDAWVEAKKADRFVTVKGLAEREVPADLVVWSLTFEDADNDLKALNKRIGDKRETIVAFVTSAGVAKDSISFAQPKMIDFSSSRYYGDGRPREFRYQARVAVTIRSDKVALVKKLMQDTAKLIDKGVVLVEEDYENKTQFLFTKLNEIKPEMIEAATKNAREAAEKFAQDSGATVGKIRNANQGYFTINDRDPNSPDYKKVRVVTSVQYYLADE